MATEPTLSDIPLVLLNYESLRQLEQCILPSPGIRSIDDVETVVLCFPTQYSSGTVQTPGLI
jgi:hypothetical protein